MNFDKSKNFERCSLYVFLCIIKDVVYNFICVEGLPHLYYNPLSKF